MYSVYYDNEEKKWKKIPTYKHLKESIMSIPNTKIRLDVLKEKRLQKRNNKSISEFNAKDVSIMIKSEIDKKHYYRVLQQKLSAEKSSNLNSLLKSGKLFLNYLGFFLRYN